MSKNIKTTIEIILIICMVFIASPLFEPFLHTVNYSDITGEYDAELYNIVVYKDSMIVNVLTEFGTIEALPITNWVQYPEELKGCRFVLEYSKDEIEGCSYNSYVWVYNDDGILTECIYEYEISREDYWEFMSGK